MTRGAERDAHGCLNVIAHMLSKIPYEDLRAPKIELPKRQKRGDYRDIDYPFEFIPEKY